MEFKTDDIVVLQLCATLAKRSDRFRVRHYIPHIARVVSAKQFTVWVQLLELQDTVIEAARAEVSHLQVGAKIAYPLFDELGVGTYKGGHPHTVDIEWVSHGLMRYSPSVWGNLRLVSVDTAPALKEVSCKTCSKMNDVGVATCWLCGNKP